MQEERSLLDYIAYQIYGVCTFEKLELWQRGVVMYELLPKYIITANSF